MPDSKGVRHDPGFTARRTQQPQTTTEDQLDLLEIFFHNQSHINAARP
jgi:hypothetical protein